MRYTLLLSLCITSVTANLTLAQGPPKPTRKIEAMKKLSDWVGEWKGKGWIEMQGQRSNFNSTESIKMKVGGVAILVEGVHKAKYGDREVTVHDAMGVLTYDDKQDEYRFQTFLATGQVGNYKAELLKPGSLRWTIDDMPFGTMQYTIDFTADSWHEVGRISRDGKEWKKMFDMQLKKQR